MNFDSLRNWLSSVAADLRSRHLLPVLGLLVAAAIVLPIVLSQSGKPQTLAALPASPAVTTAAPALGAGTPSSPEPTQNYLTGPDHDPFKDPTASTVASKATKTSRSGSSGSTSKAASSAKTGASDTTATDTVTVTKTTPLPTCPAGETPGVIGGKDYCLTICHKGETLLYQDGKYRCTAASSTVTPVTTPAYRQYAPDVTFGPVGETGSVYHHLARFELLPDNTAPVAEFLGVEASDHHTAVFWVSGAAKVTGGADCSPSATQCSFVAVKPGGAFYLDLSSNGRYLVDRIQYDSVTELASDGSYAVDTTGQTLVDAWQSRLATLKTLSYSADTGLVTVNLGTSQATPAHTG